jgi:ABC-type sulfate transport system permease subunit
MSAREQLQKVTNGWYSIALLGAVANVLMNGLGIFTIVWAVLSTGFMFVITWWIGRKLLNRSSLMRSVCIVLSVLGSVLGVLAIFALGKALFEGASLFDTAIELGLTGMGLSMNFRTFRTLTDANVKSYFTTSG